MILKVICVFNLFALVTFLFFYISNSKVFASHCNIYKIYINIDKTCEHTITKTYELYKIIFKYLSNRH